MASYEDHNDIYEESVVYHAITNERDFQDSKWGDLTQKRHAIPSWLLIMKKELQEAEDAWMKESNYRALEEILQVVATGVACMQQHGIVERPEIILKQNKGE
jgi:hypothetical protein